MVSPREEGWSRGVYFVSGEDGIRFGKWVCIVDGVGWEGWSKKVVGPNHSLYNHSRHLVLCLRMGLRVYLGYFVPQSIFNSQDQLCRWVNLAACVVACRFGFLVLALQFFHGRLDGL